MASSSQSFYCLWQNETIRDRLFEYLSKQDICAVRVANSACCNLLTKRLFIRININFTANTFTNPGRVQALSRIGHHIEHLTFSFPHSDATFLPPLIHTHTGQEILFLYNPHTSMASALTRPKYGNSELGDILTQQYPPLFHAASNVPSFINAMKHLTNIRHLTVKTPGQDPSERYRRGIVDYALISLRISVERAPLTKLSKLSLSGVHPAAFNYLRYKSGFGALPSAALRWRQIKKLYISVDAWDFYGPCPGLDHLKIIDDYVRDFAPQLEKFNFAWLGRRGPCPIALSGDPLFAAPRNSKKLFAEVTSPMSPLPPRPYRSPLVMPRLRCLSVRNATMNAPQLKNLIASHRATVREFDFDNVALIRGGSWDDVLAPLTENSGDAWSRRSFGGASTATSEKRPGTSRSYSSGSGSAVASSAEDEVLSPSSAAAAAASRELFEVDLEGMVFGGVNDVDNFEAGVEEWARNVTAAAAASQTSEAPKSEEEFFDDGLASDIEAAKQASENCNTKLKQHRLRKKRTHHRGEENSSDHKSERKEKESHSRTRSDSHKGHKHSRSDDVSSSSATNRERSQSRHRRHRRHHRKHHSEEIPSLPSMPSMPEVVGSDDEDASGTPYYYCPSPKKMDISVPILNPAPLPVMLQPTVYDPSAKCGPLIGNLQPEPIDDGLSPAQRIIEADMLAEAEEAAARSSALKRARDAVMTKLSREFARRKNSSEGISSDRLAGGNNNNYSHKQDSAAVTAGLSALNLGMAMPPPQRQYHHNNNSVAAGFCGNTASASSGFGFRLREGLFGKSMANVSVVSDHSAMVPLMFSRS
ncbi:hypothetical protein QBC35DRAFT_64276 [Podospora australis]|uniref:Uncharacterized protein n=1 Tax=Podospora australis TaxID=1536484 RepID=A0AAN6WYM9_9PEZI|nr:hypothetical protein QBC35DRAFT_64276 [Podospora australis]